MDDAVIKALFVAIATANHHPAPNDWAELALAAYVVPAQPSPETTPEAPAVTPTSPTATP